MTAPPDIPIHSGSADLDVSVIIPTWKAADFVGRAIRSALASSGVTLEVIVVDDASPDETYSALQALAAEDARIVVDQLPANGGPSVARNRALDCARGRYVAILDADDTMMSDRLSKLVALADDSGADIIVDNMIEVDEQGQALGPAPFVKSPAFATARDIHLADYVRFNQPLKPIDCLGYLKPLFRRETLTRTGHRYDPALRNSEDYYLVAHLLASGARMQWTPAAGYNYQRSTTSTSHRLTAQQTAAWLVAERDFLGRYHDSFTGAERVALGERSRLLRDVELFVRAVDAAKAWKFLTLAGLLAADPRGAVYVVSMFAKIALDKAAGRKPV